MPGFKSAQATTRTEPTNVDIKQEKADIEYTLELRRQEVENLEKRASDLTSLVEAEEDSLLNLQGSCLQLKEEKKQLESNIEILEKERGIFEKSFAEDQRRYDLLKEELEDKLHASGLIAESNKGLKQKNKKLEDEYADLTIKVAESTDSLSNLKAESQKELEHAKETLSALKLNIEIEEGLLKETKEAAEKAKVEQESVLGEILRTQEKLDETKRGCEVWKQKLRELEQEYKEKRESLSKELEDYKKDQRASIDLEIGEAKKELEDIRSRRVGELKKAQAELDKEKKELSKKRGELQTDQAIFEKNLNKAREYKKKLEERHGRSFKDFNF